MTHSQEFKNTLITMRTTISEVKIGTLVNSGNNGKGMVSAKTKRSVTVTFQNGNTVKNTYKTADAYFYESEF